MILFDNIIINDDENVEENWDDEKFEIKRRKIEKDGESLFSRIVK
jgi:hypothetical protein